MSIPKVAETHYGEHKENHFSVNWLTLLRQDLYLRWYGKVNKS